MKLDLHYSHKDSTVLELMEKSNLIPLYVPAKCTDVLQECDTVLNKPFKEGCRHAFTNWLHVEFDKFIASGGRAENFNPKLTQACMKAELPSFVEASFIRLRTEDFKAVIAKSFSEDGCFKIMRDTSAAVAEVDTSDIQSGIEDNTPEDEIIEAAVPFCE